MGRAWRPGPWCKQETEVHHRQGPMTGPEGSQACLPRGILNPHFFLQGPLSTWTMPTPLLSGARSLVRGSPTKFTRREGRSQPEELTRTGLTNQGRETLGLQRPLNSRRRGLGGSCLRHLHTHSGSGIGGSGLDQLRPQVISGDLVTPESPSLMGPPIF